MTVSLVTGGCGFVGAAIARALKARGDEVIVLDVLTLVDDAAGADVDETRDLVLPGGLEHVLGAAEVHRPNDVLLVLLGVHD